MSRRTVLLLAFTPLLLLLVGVGAYYAWGGVMKRRFHARLDALRAEGIPTRWEDLVEPVVPDGENGADLLAEAEATRERVEEAAEEDIGWLSPYEVERWNEEDDVGEEDRLLAVQVVARLAPYYAKLDEVLARPHLKLPREGALGGVKFLPVQNAIQYAAMRANLDPTWRDEALDRMFGLLARWRAHSGIELITRPINWGTTCRLLRRRLQDEPTPAEPLLTRWGATLECGTEGLPEDLRIVNRESLVQHAWLVGEWAAGRDPFAEMRATFEEFGSLLADVSLDGEVRDFVDGVDAFTRSGLRVPWEARWWGRPFLWRGALRLVEGDAEFRQLDLADLDALRTWLDEVRQHTDWRETLDRVNGVRLALQQVAVTRLACLALAAHDYAVAKGHMPASLAELAPLLGGSLPEDPLTGEPFRYEVLGDEVILQADPGGSLIRFALGTDMLEDASEAELLEAMEEGVLRWRLRLP